MKFFKVLISDCRSLQPDRGRGSKGFCQIFREEESRKKPVWQSRARQEAGPSISK